MPRTKVKNKIKKPKKLPKPKKKVVRITRSGNRTGRPDRRALKSIYRMMLTGSTSIRLEALAKALQWYDAAKSWAEFDPKKKSLLGVKSYKAIDQANALRQRAHDNLNKYQLRETALRSAVELFEGALKEVVKTKSISTVYEHLAKIADRLKKREERVTSKYKKFLDLIVDSVRPTNTSGEIIQLRVHDPDMKSPPKDRWVTGDVRTLNYTKKHVDMLFGVYKKDGLFSVINLEMSTLAALAANPYDTENSRFHLDPARQAQLTPKLYDNVVKYLKENPQMLRKFVRKKVVRTTAKRKRKKK